MKKILAVIAVFAVLNGAPARADDDNALPDGGSIITTTDGGSNVSVDLSSTLGAYCRTLAIRCEGDQSARYKMCTASTCTATSASTPLDHDRTFDIPVNCKPGQNTTPKKSIALTTDDAGVPLCKVWFP